MSYFSFKIFLFIFATSILSSSANVTTVCYPQILPKMFGGSSGDTSINDISTSIAQTTVFGGWSTDATLVGTSTQTAIIGLLDSTGNLQWLKYVQKTSILAVKFSTGSSTVFVMAIQSNPTKFVVMDDTGTRINSLQVLQKSNLPEVLYPNGLIFLSTLEFCYACKNWNGYFEVGCYQAAGSTQSIGGTGRSLLGYGTFQTGGVTSGRVTALTTTGSDETYAFAGGRISTSLNQAYLLLTSFKISDFSNNFQYVIDFGMSPTSYYDFVTLNYYYDTNTNCDNVLTGCLQHSDTSSTNTVLLLYFITGGLGGCGGTANSQNSISTKSDKFANNQFFPNKGQVMNKPSISSYTQCLAIQATSYLSPYNVLLYIPSAQTINLCTVTPILGLISSMACSVMSNMVDSHVTFSTSIFLSTGDVFMVGQLQQLVGDITSLTPAASFLSKKIGFIMNFDSQTSCLSNVVMTVGYSLVDLPAMNFQFLYNTFNPSISVPTFSSGGLQDVDFVKFKSGISNRFCTQKYQDQSYHIIPSSQPNFTYEVSNVEQFIHILAFTQIPSGPSTCSDNTNLIYSAEITSLTGLLSHITFIPDILQFSIFTTNPLTAGTYMIKVYGTAVNGQYGVLTFYIIVHASCDLGTISCVISPCPVPSQTYTILNPSSILSVALPTLAVQVSDCIVQYSITSTSMNTHTTINSLTSTPSSSNTIYDANWLFSSSDNGLLQGSTSFTYFVTIEAYILYMGIHYSPFPLSLILTITDCASSIITPVNPISDPIYFDISSQTATSILELWTQSIPECPSIAYSLSPSSSVFYISGAVYVRASQPVEKGYYTVVLTGVIPNFVSTLKQVQVMVIITNNCATVGLSIPLFNPNTFTYIISSDSILVSFPDWSSTYSPSCSPLTYSALINGTDFNLNTMTAIQFDSTNRMFFVFTDSNNDIGTYLITVFGANPLYEVAETTSFTIIIQVDCSIVLIQTSPESDKLYYLRDPLQIFTLPLFTTLTACEPIIYNLEQSPAITGAIDVNFETRIMTIYSFEAVDLGTFTLTWQGIISSGVFGQIQFNVEIIDSCSSTKVESDRSGQEFYYYQSLQGLQILEFTEFSDSIGNCGVFTDQAFSLRNGIAYPLSPYFKFIPEGSPKVSFICNDSSCLGSYKIKIVGSLPSPFPSGSFTFTIHSICEVTTLTQTNQIQNFTLLQVKGPAITYTFTEYSQTPNCGQKIFYSAKLVDGSALPYFISFSSKQYKFVFYPSSFTNAGLYQLKLIASLKNTGGPVVSTVINDLHNFFVEISGIPNTILNTPPYFENELPQNQIFVADAGRQILTLPNTVDDENDDIIIDFDFGTASLFASSSEEKIVLVPTIKNLGDFPIKVRLYDNNTFSKSNYYEFSIKILSLAQLIEMEQELNVTSKDYQTLIRNCLGDKDLQAKIKSIDFSGTMVVNFSKEIQIPSNFSQFEDRNLLIQVIQSQEDSVLNLTWKIMNFSETDMTIKLNFTMPGQVSSRMVVILIKFIDKGRS